MKILIPCRVCLELMYKDIDAKGYYDILCEKGHRNIILLQEMPFELLFTSGVVFFSDGYYREAIFNFASSLERFMKFCIRVFVISGKADVQVFDKTWGSKKLMELSPHARIGA